MFRKVDVVSYYALYEDKLFNIHEFNFSEKNVFQQAKLGKNQIENITFCQFTLYLASRVMQAIRVNG